VVALMVQGCSSWAGKSFLVTALARSFARRGVKTAPFKAFNMSNNARVVDDGEIAAAQYFQALAAGIRPDVRMNPVLVKPEAESSSQVVLLGRVNRELGTMSWRARTASLWPHIEETFRSLAADFDLVIVEGAGSPAEMNLWDVDVANMRVAELAGASVLLVADIDRGGAFAHLFGTWSLLPERHRVLIRGFLLNKFRGDPALLEPAPTDLERLTGVPLTGVIPMLRHFLPDEDGAAPVMNTPSMETPTVAVIRYPSASNLDEFKPLEQVNCLRWAWTPDEIAASDIVVLPGSKHVTSDLAWLRDGGFVQAVSDRVKRGGMVLGICGGMQMLGERIEDPAGVEGGGEAEGEAEGLGLLPLVTTFHPEKLTRMTECRFRAMTGSWSQLGGVSFAGYEIRHGRTDPTTQLVHAIEGGLGFVDGPVLGVYAHGMFEESEVLAALFGGIQVRGLDETFDALADVVEAHTDFAFIEELAGTAP
jgi:adenosylcobyric acid synthase